MSISPAAVPKPFRRATLATLLLFSISSTLPAEVATKFPAEWQLPLVHTSPGFALIDGETGHTRIARMDGSGNITWTPPIATGIAQPSDVATGRFDGSDELILLTSPDANRVMMLDPALSLPFPRVLAALSGIGPSGLAATGTADRELMISSVLNGATPGGFEVRFGIAKPAEILAETLPSSLTPTRLQPVGAQGNANHIAIYTEPSGANTRVGLAARSGGAINGSLKGTFTGQVQLATLVQSTFFPTRSYSVAWRAGSNQVNLLNLSTPVTPASTLTSNLVNLPSAISAIVPVPAGGIGNITEGVIALRADGTKADVYRVNSAGTGLQATGETIDPAPGQFLTAIAPVPGGGYVRLSGPTAGGRSGSWENFLFNGSQWVSSGQGTLEEIPQTDATRATLLFFDRDPALAEGARLLGLRELAAWTRRTNADAVPDTIVAEEFLSSAGGLTSVGPRDVLAPPGTSYVVATQVDPGVSIVPLADVRSAFQPELEISPPSGHFTQTLQVTARYNRGTHTLRFRKDGGAWQPFPTALPVAWDGDYEFMLESLTAPTRGGIVRRSYTFDKAAIATLDSDNDGVPDFVEAQFGLDPFGGSDSDGDGYSDLDEILAGKDPADPLSSPSERLDIGRDIGIRLAALARAHTTTAAADGTEISAATLTGNLLAAAPIALLDTALPDGTTRAATLRSSTAVPRDEVIALSTPLYFQTTTANGREIQRMAAADPPAPFTPTFTPTGNDLSTNAGLWLTSAQNLALGWPVATARTELAPVDTAVSILLEEIAHTAWIALPGNSAPLPALNEFTLFAAREPDRLRTPLAPATLDALRGNGFSFRSALTLANTAAAGMAPAVNDIYLRHAATSATNRSLILPLDALRIVLRGGALPAGYAGATTTARLNAARTAYNTARNQSAQAYRPLATWTLEILENPAAPGVYQRTSDATAVALFDDNGSAFALERGLGLAPGTRFTVTGFTDTPPAAGLPTMEVRTAVLAFRPAASDRDHDANLLDDEWERFFFGTTGQDPYSQPHGGGYSLLQYFLSGTDPRGGMVPAGPPVDLFPQLPIIAPAAGGGFTLDFIFPAAYQDQVGFVIERSTTLAAGSWLEIPGIPVTSLGGDELRATIPPAEAPPGKAFFRISIALE